MINKKQGIHSVVISVGKWIDREEQIGIASHPYENNIFGVDKADDLQKIQDDMREHLCNSKNFKYIYDSVYLHLLKIAVCQIMCVRRRQLKSKFSYRRYEHPIIWHTSDELSPSIFFPGIDRLQKNIESSSEGCQMMGYSNQRYVNFYFICWHLVCNFSYRSEPLRCMIW